ncbi:family 43 glycosylhydrolase [Streptomonospora sp. PA3]|uniref:family 43 glycosylhydrolase n=1 Tax=Streptomonospora sp. PA3 TaxID=2607326 RepID=UPI0012DD7EFB|nr:family 43 glycosylhydrolase [Streptomonospora sp. PA3]MUL43043.1 family 43 glycosylhydrolase [Streptomonospora sp. PA3]
MIRPRVTLLLPLCLLLLVAPAASVSADPTADSSAARGAESRPAAASPAAAPGLPYENPIKPVRGADPWMEYYDGNYYLITTSWTSELTIRKSPTLAGIATAPSVQVYSAAGTEQCCNIWAPEMHLLDGPEGKRWYIYYNASRDVADYNPTQRLQVLRSEGLDPMGPYTYQGSVGLDEWQLDASVLEMGDDLYLLGTYHDGSTQNLFIQALSDPTTVTGPRRRLSRPTYDWERQGAPVQEAPEPLYHGDDTFIVYSTSFCDTPDYKLGMLTYTGGDPMDAGSWRKSPEPVFQRDDADGVYGPGHNGFFKSPDGTEDWIVYHANDTADGGCTPDRTTRAQKFEWNADGTPNFGTPEPTGVTLTGPSGETGPTPTAYRLVNRNSGLCLAIEGGSGADGATAVQTRCEGGQGTDWRVEGLADGTSRLVNRAGGGTLDVADCSTADGADVRQWSWLDNTCQRFRLVLQDAGGWVSVVNVNSGKVLDVANCGTAEGVNVRQWSWLDNHCQQWRLAPVAS